MADKCDQTDCWCHLDWHCEHAGMARMFGGDREWGEPYCYCLPFVVRERFDEPEMSGKIGLVEFIGILIPPMPCQYRLMFDAMAHAGFGVLSTRIKNGVSKTTELKRIYWDNLEYLARTGQQ